MLREPAGVRRKRVAAVAAYAALQQLQHTGMLREPDAPAGILRKRVAAVAAYAALSH
jgi:hypothetical protein